MADETVPAKHCPDAYGEGHGDHGRKPLRDDGDRQGDAYQEHRHRVEPVQDPQHNHQGCDGDGHLAEVLPQPVHLGGKDGLL